MANVIKCDLYDHFEIACMRRSQVLLELHSGEKVEGVASDLATKDGKEFLLLKNNDGERHINLMDIEFLVFANSAERISIS